MKFKKWLEDNRALASMYSSRLGNVPQEPEHHPEGNVLIHSRMVRNSLNNAISTLSSYNGELKNILSQIDFRVNPYEMSVLVMAAWLHDIGKVSATGIDEKGRLHSRNHQDRNHWEPILNDLGTVAPEGSVKFYNENKELIDFLILHHMDFVSGSFSKSFIAENFDNGSVKNSSRMKLLLILMWADKLGRGKVSLTSHEKALMRSSEMSIARSRSMNRSTGSFQGDAASMLNMLRSKGLSDVAIRANLAKKFGLSSDELDGLMRTQS